jgi:hypothetical protein
MFTIGESETDVVIDPGNVVPSLSELLAQMDAMRTATETADGLNTDVAAAEALRVTAEAGRVASESTRVANETARISAENLRASAETARLSAENGRASAESGRVSAETARASAESSRASAETARASAEAARVSAENARVEAENARASAETTRAAFYDGFSSQLAEIASTDGHSLSQRQAIFGAVWDKGESPILTRLGAMSGATVAPGLDAMPGSVKTVTIDGTETMTYNRYVAESALFDWPEVTDSYGNVFIRIPKIYLRKIDTPTSLTWYASRMPFEGCYLPKCFWDFENSRELDYVLVGKYKASLSADGLRLESKPDVFPLYGRSM